MMQIDNHSFQGLRRDIHPIRQDNKFLWDAHNIRLTNRDDNTLLSITNEKGTSGPLVTYQGIYCGHCILENYLVLFTYYEYTGADKVKHKHWYIYRTEESNDGFRTIILFHQQDNWNTGWNKNNPIETLGISETEFIKKVYWTDGINQPRVINIKKPELVIPETYWDACIVEGNDFSIKLTDNKSIAALPSYHRNQIPKLPLYTKEILDFYPSIKFDETISVEKIYGAGEFSPGTVQYAFSYYNKYGQESNIFYTTPLYYTSYIDRGAKSDDKVSNSFRIAIDSPDYTFEYIRVYSIHRTSIDSEPTVKVVGDYSLRKYDEKGELDLSGSIIVVDHGTEGYTITPDMLLYIGGRHLIAGTMCGKDGTLFLGDVSLPKQTNLQDIKDIINGSNATGSCEWDTHLIEKQPLKIDNGVNYQYFPRLSASYQAGFKYDESYICGVQAQFSTGEWSAPIYIGSKILCEEEPWKTYPNGYSESMELTISSADLSDVFRVNNIVRMRACIVSPTNTTKNILCQGLLSPTVFSAANRANNDIYAMSSWFFRPHVKEFSSTKATEAGGNSGGNRRPPQSGWVPPTGDTTNSKTGEVIPGNSPIDAGANIEWRHNYPLYADKKPPNNSNTVDYNPGVEIQGMDYYESLTKISNRDAVNLNNLFAVDENVITIHSPEVEFDESFENIDLSNTYLRIIGAAQLSAISGDIDIEAGTTAAAGASGFIHKYVGYKTGYNKPTNGGLVSGPFYNDGVYTSDDGGIIGIDALYKVYPWHRTGSLNNDIARTDTTRTSVLNKKKISNLKFFGDNISISAFSEKYSGPIDYNITTPKVFSSNEVVATKVLSEILGSDVLYMGNVNTVVSSNTNYPIRTITDWGGEEALSWGSSREPVSIKYKSTKHIVCTLGNSLLPIHKDLKGQVQSGEVSFPKGSWIYGNGGHTRPFVKIEGLVNGHINAADIDSYVHSGWYTITLDKNQYYIYMIKKTGDGKTRLVHFPPGMTLYAELATNETNRSSTGFHPLGTQESDFNGYVYIGPTRYYRIYTRSIDSKTVAIITEIDPNEEEGTPTVKVGLYRHTFEYKNLGEGNNEPDNSMRSPYMLIGELRKKVPVEVTEEEAMNMLWIPAGPPVNVIPNSDEIIIPFEYGDTWYSRYDCLKTYPFTNEDTNSIIEIGSFMCETRINIDGRTDSNRGKVSNINMSPQNFNLFNEVYNQKDNFFNYRIFDESWYKQNRFSNQITFSTEKHTGEDVDAWTNIAFSNTVDMDGTKGPIIALKSWNDYLLCFQEKAVSQVLFNSRAQIPVSDGVPIEISNGYKVDGSRALGENIGCSNKWSIVSTSYGIYFLDSNTGSVYSFDGKLNNISDNNGMAWWSKQSYINGTWHVYGSQVNGIRSFYDAKYRDIYFTPGPVPVLEKQPDALCFSEQLGQFTSFMSYGGTQAMFNLGQGFFSLRNGGEANTILYQNNVGDYNNFYGSTFGWDISFISNGGTMNTKIFDTIEMPSDIYDASNNDLLDVCPINYMRVSNEYQDTEDVTVDNINMRKKFRIWRGLLPRHKGTMQRIRNPWAMIKLGWKPSLDDPNYNKRSEIHDVAVKYTN